MVSDDFADRGAVIRCAARVLSAAVAITPRLGMRRATDVRLELLELMEALDDFELVVERDPAELDGADRAAAEQLAQRLYAVAELIDAQARSFPGDRTHDVLERIAYRTHDVARRLHHLSQM